MGYQPKIYRKQGGAEMVVASGGDITVESGGTLQIKGVETIEGVLTVASGGSISYANGGYATMPIVAKTKDNKATRLVAGTINMITCSSTGSECNLPVPTAGAMLYAVCAARTNPGTYTLASTKDFVGLTTNKLKFDAAGEMALLISATTAWSLVTATAAATS